MKHLTQEQLTDRLIQSHTQLLHENELLRQELNMFIEKILDLEDKFYELEDKTKNNT